STVLAVLLLSACASPPRPPAPPIFAAPAPRPAPAASAPARAPVERVQADPAIATPVRPSAPVAVTARFPEPSVTFATPAFESGRTTFTSNDELGTILRGLARGAAIGENSS